MKTEILKIKGDWEEVVNDCRATVKKPPLGKEPSSEWKKKILVSEHDPIRDIEIKFIWRNIKYWIAMHWKTHIWRSRTNSQRNDRQSEYDRNKAPQDSLVDFIGDPNVQHVIDTMRKRLCFQASPETRAYAEDLKVEVANCGEKEISDSFVPNCIYRCGCSELMQDPGKRCSFYEHLCEEEPAARSADILERYEAYNRYFYKHIWKGDTEVCE